MNAKKHQEVTIQIPIDIYDKAKKIVEFINQYDRLMGIESKEATLEAFIVGSLVQNIEQIELFNNQIFNIEGKLQNKLKQYTKQKGYKQVEIAKATGIDEATISLIMSNRNQPSLENFLNIWSILGCPPLKDIFYRVPS